MKEGREVVGRRWRGKVEPSLLVWSRVRQLRRVSLRSSQDQLCSIPVERRPSDRLGVHFAALCSGGLTGDDAGDGEAAGDGMVARVAVVWGTRGLAEAAAAGLVRT